MGPSSGSPNGLRPEEAERLAAIRSAASLEELAGVLEAGTDHAAYFEAKRAWYDLRGKELGPPSRADGLPGDRIVIDGRPFHVHGITHAGTAAEREYLRDHVSRFVAADEAVYCEQGIRPMYFGDVPAVREMDDFRWAMARCEALELDDRLVESPDDFDGVAEDLDGLAAQFRAAAFALIERGSDLYGEAYSRTLGDLAASFLMSHEDFATGTDFRSFRLSRRAAEDPTKLGDLQRYYERSFLPPPLEREWLGRHDRELEIVTHARNERMADYVVYHHADPSAVHVIVGAAHQPGVGYYLEEHRDGRRSLTGFDYVD